MNKLERIKDRRVQDLIQRYLELLQENFKGRLISVAIFGSVARNEAKFPGSDIDFLVVVEGIKGTFGRRIHQMMDFDRKLRETAEFKEFTREKGTWPLIQEYIFSPEEIKHHPPLLLDLTSDVYILYDKEDFLKNELQTLQETFAKLGTKKVTLPNGEWFWILKPKTKLHEAVEL